MSRPERVDQDTISILYLFWTLQSQSSEELNLKPLQYKSIIIYTYSLLSSACRKLYVPTISPDMIPGTPR